MGVLVPLQRKQSVFLLLPLEMGKQVNKEACELIESCGNHRKMSKKYRGTHMKMRKKIYGNHRKVLEILA